MNQSSGTRPRASQQAFGGFTPSQSVQANDSLRRGTPLRGSFAAVQPSKFGPAGSSFTLPGVHKGRLSQEPVAGRTRAAAARSSQIPGMRMR
jgi:hypothetical protein